MVQALIERNAIADMPDNASRTPREMARYYQHVGMDVMLERYLTPEESPFAMKIEVPMAQE